MNGTIFSVTRAIDLIPPMITEKTTAAMNQADQPAVDRRVAPPATLFNCT